MTRSKRMDPAVKVAESREQAAARIMGQAEQKLLAQERKLAELITYRDQYSKQFTETTGLGMGVARLQDYRIFLARLNTAIEQQQRVLHQSEQDCQRQRQHWLTSRSRTQALGKVVDRYRQEERRSDERRDQNDADEHAQRRRAKDEEL